MGYNRLSMLSWEKSSRETDNKRNDPLQASSSYSTDGGQLNAKASIFSIKRSYLRGSGGVKEAQV